MTQPEEVYAETAAKLEAMLKDSRDKGVALPWVRPWLEGVPLLPLNHEGRPYQGSNVPMLWLAALEEGYTAPRWLTYRTAQELGKQLGRDIHVRKGEHGHPISRAGEYDAKVTDDDGTERREHRAFRKFFTVFNADQIEGLPPEYYAKIEPILSPEQRIAELEAFVKATGADIRHGGAKAYYSPKSDYIKMPPFERFETPEKYYATLLHELVHWSGHPSRENRPGGAKGTPEYAREELVAELGAAMLCARFGLEPVPDPNHAAYIDGWMTLIAEDHGAFHNAASAGQRAANALDVQTRQAETALEHANGNQQAQEIDHGRAA